MFANLSRTIAVATFSLAIGAVFTSGYAHADAPTPAESNAAARSVDVFTDGARNGPRSPFVDGARIGSRNPFVDGARTQSRDAYTDGAHNGRRDAFSEGA